MLGPATVNKGEDGSLACDDRGIAAGVGSVPESACRREVPATDVARPSSQALPVFGSSVRRGSSGTS